MASAPISEGTIPFVVGGETFQTYYKLVGTLEGRTKRPLVVLHGGPGLTHDYLIPIGDLAAHGRPVLFYDQIGSGRSSTMPEKPETFWTIDFFIDEFFNVLAHFGITDDYDVLGHSWGGILLSEIMLRRKPAGLKHAVLSNSICRMQSWNESRQALAKTLPEWIQEEIKKGWRNTPECRAAFAEFGKSYQCRLENNPPERALSGEYGYKNIYLGQAM
jgi:proline-specific peptidase